MSGYLPPQGTDYSQQTANTLGLVISNYAQILVIVTQIVATQAIGGQNTQSQVASVVTMASTNGLLMPRPTVTADGEVYNWTEYQTAVVDIMTKLRDLQSKMYGPWQLITHGRT